MHESTIAVVGLGYVGLPLTVEYGSKFEAIGYDLTEARIANYRNHIDPTGEVNIEVLKAVTSLPLSRLYHTRNIWLCRWATSLVGLKKTDCSWT